VKAFSSKAGYFEAEATLRHQYQGYKWQNMQRKYCRPIYGTYHNANLSWL